MLGEQWQTNSSSRHSAGMHRWTSGQSRKSWKVSLSMWSPSRHTVAQLSFGMIAANSMPGMSSRNTCIALPRHRSTSDSSRWYSRMKVFVVAGGSNGTGELSKSFSDGELTPTATARRS